MNHEKNTKSSQLQRRNTTELAHNNYITQAFGSILQTIVDTGPPAIEILKDAAQFKMCDGSVVNTFAGNIICYRPTNQYFSQVYGEGDGIADCISIGGFHPTGGRNPLPGPCKSCHLNQYGSSTSGRGKACRNSITMYVLAKGEAIPCLLDAPPSSLSQKGSLMSWIKSVPNVAAKAGIGEEFQLIEVKFSLKEKSFASGMKASVLELETQRVLDEKNESDAERIAYIRGLYRNFEQSSAIGVDTAKDDITNSDYVGDNPPPPPDDGIPY